MFENINLTQIINYANLLVGISMSIIFLPKLVYKLTNTNSASRTELLNAFIGIFNLRDLFNFLSHVPILFYTSSICSTAVLLVFGKMVASSKLHFPTFFISLTLFFIIGILVRFMTIRTLSIELKENGDFDAKNRLTHFNYFLMLSPALVDTTMFREASKGLFGDGSAMHNTVISSVFIIALFIACMYLIQVVRYLSAGVMIMFCAVLLIVISSFDISYLAGMSYLSSNICSLESIILSILYANLFAIFSSDLYCLCMERALVNYTRAKLLPENKIDKNKVNSFYLVCSIVIAFLSFVWLWLFLNLSVTNVLNGNGTVAKVLSFAIRIVYAISAAMQSYVILDYIRSYSSRIFILLFLVLVNCFIWTDYLCNISVFVFLLAQFLTAVNLFLKLS